MPDVFISYSRTDIGFVRELHNFLTGRDNEVWVDWEDIPPTAQWESDIRAGIEGADAFVFVISPDSLASAVCLRELGHAEAQGKRLVPLLRRDVGSAAVPQALATLNWIFCREGDDGGAAFETLVRAIGTDLEWVRAHTRLLVRAVEWDANGRDRSFLLRGSDLADAERRLAGQARKDPAPTPLQTEYVLASRGAATARQRITLGGVLVALAVAVSLAILALIQRNDAISRAHVAQSREVAVSAAAQLGSDPELSLLLAVDAVGTSRTPEAVRVLRESLSASKVRQTVAIGRPLTGAAFAPDGRSVALTDLRGVGRVWVPGRRCPVAFGGGRIPVYELAFGRDPSRLVSNDVESFTVWRRRGSRFAREHVIRSSGRAITGADGDTVLTSHGSSTDVWSARTGKQIATLRGDPLWAGVGGLVAVRASDDVVRIVSVRTPGRAIVRHVPPRSDLVFGPSGRHVLVTTERGARLLDTADGKLTPFLAGVEGTSPYPPIVTFGPGERRVVVAAEFLSGESGGGPTLSGDWSVRLFDTSSGRQLAQLRGHAGPVSSVSFSPDGRYVATGGKDGSVRVWDARNGDSVTVLRGHDGAVAAVAFSPGGRRIVSASSDGTARIWDPGLAPKPLLRGALAALSDNGQFAAAATRDGRIRVVRTAGGAKPKTLQAAPGVVERLAVSSDGQLVVENRSVLGVSSGRQLARLPGSAFLSLSADGRWALTDTGALWDVRRGVRVHAFHRRTETGVFTPDDRLLATTAGSPATALGGDDASLWDVRSGKLLHAFRVGDANVYVVALTADGSLLATGQADGSARIWDVATHRRLAVLHGHDDQVVVAGFSPDGRLLATGSKDTKARVWDVSTGESVTVLSGHQNSVQSVAFSPDDELVLTGGADGRAILWQAATGEQLAVLAGTAAVERARFVDGARAIAVAREDHTVSVTPCDACGSVADLLALASRRTTRDLTPAERRRYLHEASPPARATGCG